MAWLNSKDHILFIGSPQLDSLDDMADKHVFLSDLPLYDVTRDLVLLNQQRVAELEVRSSFLPLFSLSLSHLDDLFFPFPVIYFLVLLSGI